MFIILTTIILGTLPVLVMLGLLLAPTIRERSVIWQDIAKYLHYRDELIQYQCEYDERSYIFDREVARPAICANQVVPKQPAELDRLEHICHLMAFNVSQWVQKFDEQDLAIFERIWPVLRRIM